MKIKYWDKSEYGKINMISNERDIKIGYFKNCIVEGHSTHYPQPLIKTDNELLLPTIERFMSLDRGTVYESTMEWECKNINVNKVETTPVFYFVYNCANYFHWIYDTIPYLYSYFKEKNKCKELKLLINVPENKDDLYMFVYETLALLGIKKDDLIFLDKNTKYETLIIGSSLTHNRMSLKPPHSNVFSIVNSIKGISSDIKRVYVSRRTWTRPKSNNIGTDYTNERRCVNEDEVVEMLKGYGFEEIFCEDLSMEEKIGLFRSAEIVVGPIGGGMANILFCKPNTNVISINSPEFFKINKRLEYALTHTKLCMFDNTEFVSRKNEIITGKNALSISGGMNSPWKVDIDKLNQKIKTLL
mgnify:FL=1|tara:strand:- start:881 stop:1954 length:1074 start_codon:yes stop_codon:yes gene_type:complete